MCKYVSIVYPVLINTFNAINEYFVLKAFSDILMYYDSIKDKLELICPYLNTDYYE